MKKRLILFTLPFCLFACSSSPPSNQVSTSSTDSSFNSSSQPFPSHHFSVKPAFPQLSFEDPLYLTFSPKNNQIVYVVERTGRIYRFENQESVEKKELFLDLSKIIERDGQEQGLLGFTFDPAYSKNRFIYVNYTAEQQTFISRFHVEENGTLPDLASEEVLLSFKQPFSNHNGGHLEFGPDGYLYIATGDGGSSGDPLKNAQNTNSFLGKILRIDVSSHSPYLIPEDNPFADQSAEHAKEIYAYGFRNPWRFSFDSLTGNLWVADVGQNKIEEINLVEKGKNYGWNIYEGSHIYSGDPLDSEEYVMPVWEYDHSNGQSVTGGYVYRGNDFPELYGMNLFGDFISGSIWALELNNKNKSIISHEVAESNRKISSFGLSPEGELYIIDFAGGIYRLERAK